MRKFLALILAMSMLFALAACSRDDGEKERDCGLFITIEADDVFVVSCGTDKGSDSVSNADDDQPLPVGDVVHFDIGGKNAEKKADHFISYSICIYDKDMEVIKVASFNDNFGNMAKIELTVTADHYIIHTGDPISRGGDVIVDIEQTEPESDVSIAVPVVTISGNEDAQNAVNDSIAAVNSDFSGSEKDAYKSIYDANIAAAGSGATETDFAIARTVRTVRGDTSMLSLRMVDRATLANENSLKIFGLSYDTSTGAQILFADLSDDAEALRSFCTEKVLTATTDETRFKSGSVIFNTGYTEVLSTLVSDGHWYFNDEGMVIVVNPGEIAPEDSGFFEFTIPYSELDGRIHEKFMPLEREGDYGNISAVTVSEINNLISVGDVSDSASFAVTVTGNVYDLCVYTAEYSSGSYTPINQLRYCSDISHGGAFAISYDFSSPHYVYVGFYTADGTRHSRLISLGSDGSPTLIDLDGGDDGLTVTSGYTCDLLGDGSSAGIKFNSGKLSVTYGGSEYDLDIPVSSEARIQLYDIDGDCEYEIFVSGKNSEGESVMCGCKLDTELYSIMETQGGVYDFNGSRVMVSSVFDFKGELIVYTPYTRDRGEDGKISLSSSSDTYFFASDTKLTLISDLSVNDVSCKSGSEIKLLSTDCETYIDCVNADGVSLRLTVSESVDGTWTVDGSPVSALFQ